MNKKEFLRLIKKHNPCEEGLELVASCKDLTEVFTEMSTSDWMWLLVREPQFADNCGRWDSFSSCYWVRLLADQPQFADKCDKWDRLSSERWAWLLAMQPQLAKYKKKQKEK